MLKIGLTGGIGSGKSAVALQFSKLGIDVVDADIVARELTEPGTEYFEKIVDYFGEGAIKNDGTLDRRFVKEQIFEDNTKKRWLEKLLHPAIREEMRLQINDIKSPYGIIVIPLLIEAQTHELVDRILIVEADEKIQIARIKARDNLNDKEAKRIIDSQATKTERRAHADDIIHNHGTLDALNAEVTKLHQRYLKLAEK